MAQTRILNISLGSLAETKYLVHFSYRLGYLSEENYEKISAGYDTLGAQLWRFYESVIRRK